MSKDSELKARRAVFKNKIAELKKNQSDVWDSMSHRVQGGYDRVQEKRLSWVEKKVQELATQEAPVLWETIFGLFTTVVPVAGIVKWLLPHSQRAFKIGKVTGFINDKREIQKLDGPAFVEFVNQFEGKYPNYMRDGLAPSKWVKDVVELNRENKIVSLYTSEIEDALRNQLVKAAAGTAQYMVNKPGTQTGPSNSARKKDGDSVNFKTNALDWISKTKSAEALTLEKLLISVDDVENLKQLEVIERLFMSEETWSKVPQNFKNESSFERWIEMCVWLMTWDFGCELRPARREIRVWGATAQHPTRIDLPPVGDDFWKFAVDRYCDPFYLDGDMTFAELSINPYLPPSKRKENYAQKPQIPNEEQLVNKGFYPQERLAWIWGNVVAPSLFKLNNDIATLMTGRMTDDIEIPPEFQKPQTYPHSGRLPGDG